MALDASPPVGSSYFWESINHISYSRHCRAFSCRGTGGEWGRFHFGCRCTCRVCEQGWARGTWALLPHTSPRGRVCGAGCWRVTSTPLDGCSLVGSWRVGSGSSSVARPAGSECSSSGRGWQDCGAGSQHCPGTAWCCQLLWLQSNNKCIYWDK